MDGTPRLRSAFPETPRHELGVTPRYRANTPISAAKRKSIIRPAVNATPPSNNPFRSPPIVSQDLLDAPTQRLWALAVYFVLCAWKLKNWYQSDPYDAASSYFNFLFWIVLDGTYFLSLPLLKIPWLEFSFFTFVIVWLVHVALDAFLMFHWSIQWLSIGAYMVKFFYNRELSLSNKNVNPRSLVDRSDIILGKQIINLLPEGSAVLNPELASYCLDENTRTVELSIKINQTSPDFIELIRYDLDTDQSEAVYIYSKEARRLKHAADKGFEKSDKSTPRTLRYAVSKKGLYRLQKVVDKSKLEVRRQSNDVAVVACPRAVVSAKNVDKCVGELSGVSLEVTGVPPFLVKYNKKIDHHQYSSITQTVQDAEDDGVVLDPKRPQMGWTQSKTLSFDINESLSNNGTWMYAVEEITDGLKNRVVFEAENTKKSLASHHLQAISVHKRPVIKLHGCDAEHYLRVAREDSVKMPLQIAPKGDLPASDWPLTLKYTFTSPDDGVPAIDENIFEMKHDKDLPSISRAGRYDVMSIDSQFCAGEVKEPSSCLLYNPPRPSLAYQIEEIFDKCAGRPIGTIVNFDFTGTPPFRVNYEVVKSGGQVTPKTQEFKGMRGQLEIRERSAGSYQYKLVSVADDVYSPINIRSENNSFGQNIRPPAEAYFAPASANKPVCLGTPVSVEVKLLGEGPWNLEYELVHNGKRKKFTEQTDHDTLNLETPPLTEGGKYTVVLTGVQDSSRCRTALKEERHFEVRPEQPRVAFGDINGKKSVQALETKNVKLPIKLKGLAPWKVTVQNERGLREHIFKDANSFIQADVAGLYQIESVQDSCPGIVDPRSDKFEVSWFKRPELNVRDATASEQGVRTYNKEAVCQGDEDSLTLVMSGHSPYHIKYTVNAEPVKGQKAVANKPLTVASHNAAITMDTSKAGRYTYTFNELSDGRYDDNKKHFSPLIVKQEVYALPDARFTNPGKVHGYCKDESEELSESEHENIPITLTGVPPFSLEIAVRHHSQSNVAETIRIRDILSNTYSWSLSRASLGLGAHSVQILSVKDSRGCGTAITNPSTIQIRVSAPPKIVPLDTRTDYCIGEHLAFSLSGQAPFNIFYRFQGKDRKANIATHEFRRISDHAGEFLITAIEDSVVVAGSGAKCRQTQDIRKVVHPYPTVRLSHGKTLTTDIHEGGEVELIFEFTGTPPFEWTYTRSENAKSVKGRAPRVLETKSDVLRDGFSKVVRASDEGTYEVVSIKDAHCAYASPGLAEKGASKQKLLKL